MLIYILLFVILVFVMGIRSNESFPTWVRVLGWLIFGIFILGKLNRATSNKSTETSGIEAQAPANDTIVIAGTGFDRYRFPTALKMLADGEKQYMSAQGDVSRWRETVSRAVETAPNLAIANLMKAQIAMSDDEWDLARKYYERGLDLLRQPGQPMSASPDIIVKRSDVEGNSRCFLGCVYINLAKAARKGHRLSDEQEYLVLGKRNLEMGIGMTPGPGVKQMAEDLLRSFE